MSSRLSRLTIVPLLALALAACTPAAAPSPTAAPAKPAATTAPAATAKPAAAKPAATTAPAPTAAAKPAAKTLPADYFAGKTISLMVNYSPGGPTDILARMIAPVMSNLLPGKPTVIVENRPGAGGLVGLNWLASAAKKDGTVVGVLTSPFSAQLVGSGGAQYDAAKFRWLGGVTEAQIAYAHKSLNVKAPEDLPKVSQQIILGGLSPDSNKDLGLRTYLNMLGLKYKYVTGFPGGKDVTMALERGEVTFYEASLTEWVANIVPLVKDGVATQAGQRGIFKGGKLVRDPRVADIPTYFDIAVGAKGEAVKQNLDYRALLSAVKMSVMLRAIVLPNGADQAVVDVMSKAISDTFADKEFLAQGQRQLGFDFEFLQGPDAQILAEDIVKGTVEDKEAYEHLKKLASEKG